MPYLPQAFPYLYSLPWPPLPYCALPSHLTVLLSTSLACVPKRPLQVKGDKTEQIDGTALQGARVQLSSPRTVKSLPSLS